MWYGYNMSTRPLKASKLRRITVNLDPPAAAALERAIERSDHNQTAVIARSLRFYDYVLVQMAAKRERGDESPLTFDPALLDVLLF